MMALDHLRTKLVLAVAAALTSIALFGIGTDTATAKSTVFSFSSAPSTTQAGGHPNVITTFSLGTRYNQEPVPCECNDPKDVTIHAPAGVIANPHALSVCSAAELATYTCSADSQVGLFVFWAISWIAVPMYQTTPQAGQGALLAFVVPNFGPVYTAVNARTGSDFGLDFQVRGITHQLTPPSFNQLFWGVPGLPEHDMLRFAPGEQAYGCNTNPFAAMTADIVPNDCGLVMAGGGGAEKAPISSSLPLIPFTQGPTNCSGPQTSSIEVVAYDHGVDLAEAPWPATTGCDKLSFNPSLAAAPTTTETDAASGLEVDLTVPQFQDANTPSPSALKSSTVTLPPGFSINPNTSDGKVTCSDAEANFGSEGPSSCPEFSKIGTTELSSSALPGPISGYAYLGEPKPGDRYRVILTASGFGTNLKIAGSVHLDPGSGQVVTVFDSLPQAPFQKFNLHFFGSERGILATPTQCGTYPVKATFKPWATELSDQTSTQFFTLDSGPAGRPCPDGPRPFSPSFAAGTEDNTAGRFTPFSLEVARPDGDQNVTGVNLALPPGFTAKLAGVQECPEIALTQLSALGYTGLGEQLSPACPAASQIGTVVAGAGAGSRPLFVPGRVYLAGPYKGAPLSVVVVIPAVAGSYDLGNVVIRSAVAVDPRTVQVTATSDTIPQILEGVLLRARFLQLALDRPGFTLNPTNCDPFSVRASISGDEGATSSPSAPFQVANCADLPYRPKLSIKLSGGVNRLGHPAIHAVFEAAGGEANSRAVSVTLPKGFLIDNSHIDTICTRVNFANETCPGGSLIGTAEVTTPLLDDPLKGSVYLRSSSHELPDLAIDLDGRFDIETAARVDSTKGRVRTTFESVPDAPISRIVVDLVGGHRGLLQNSERICRTKKKADTKMTGQNGVVSKAKTRLLTACSGSKRSKRNHRNGRAGR